jgi:hypothetical protein
MADVAQVCAARSGADEYPAAHPVSNIAELAGKARQVALHRRDSHR